MDTEDVSEFLKLFPPNSLHYRKPESADESWVFWSQNEGSENNSYSGDLGTPMIHDKIKSALSKLRILCDPFSNFCQFWAPAATIGGGQLVTTSGQPFVVWSLNYCAEEIAKYRLYTEKYKYNIDMNKVGIEGDHTIISGGPATAFINRLSYIYRREDCVAKKLDVSFLIPICFPSQSTCIGVLEFAFASETGCMSISETIRAVKKSDFGMARSFIGDETQANTMKVVGTYGYMSPEYAVDGVFSIKSDLFSFAVLVMEIVSGKKNRGFFHHNHHHNLLGHAWLLYQEGQLMELIDPTITNSCHLYEVLRSLELALLCVQRNPDDRPSMSTVVVTLSSEGELPEPKQPGFFYTEHVPRDAKSSSTHAPSSTNAMTITLVDGR